MTDSLTRPIPSPRDLAARPRPPAAPPVVVPPVYEAGFNRDWWEKALLAAELPHHAARLLGWGLAHLASKDGCLPPHSSQPKDLGRELRLTYRQVQLSLRQPQDAGLIHRPTVDRAYRTQARPITLTLPPADTARPEPPHPGGPE